MPDGGLSTREGKGREIPEGNKRRRSAEGKFAGRKAPTKEGLDGLERARMIRRTAAKNVVDTSGPGCPELCDGAPRTKEPAAQRTPGSWLKRQRKVRLRCRLGAGGYVAGSIDQSGSIDGGGGARFGLGAGCSGIINDTL